jgi:hypothetical protein
VWAPANLSPDGLLDAFAGFRELFPPHPATDAALKMPAAVLAGVRAPHALGPGFLVSKGDPEAQAPPVHVRWTAYSALAEVDAWLSGHADDVGAVVAAPRVAARLDWRGPVIAPGEVHRPPVCGGPGETDPFLSLVT